MPVSFPVDGAERVTFQVPGNDLRWVAHVLDALAHRWGEASAEMPEGRVRTKKGRGGGLRKLIVVGQIEDDLRRKLDPKDRSWRVRIADGGWHYFWKANWQAFKFGAGWVAARFADGKYVDHASAVNTSSLGPILPSEGIRSASGSICRQSGVWRHATWPPEARKGADLRGCGRSPL